MRSWKDRLKRSLVLLLTVALVGNSARYAMLSVSAEEIPAEETDGQKEQKEALSTEEQDTDVLAEEQNDDTETVIVQDVDTVTAEAADAAIMAADAQAVEEQETPEGEEDTEQSAHDEAEGEDADEDPQADEPETESSEEKPSEEEPQEEEPMEEITVEFTVPLPDQDLPDNEELLEGYIERLFYGDLYGGVSLFGNVGKERLKDENLTIYNTLKTYIEQIASGKSILTANLKIDGVSLTATAEQLGVTFIDPDNVEKLAGKFFSEKVDTGKILQYLLMDCPYDFYWFDKSAGGMKTQYSIAYSQKELRIENIDCTFTVALEYRHNGAEMYVNSNKANTAKAAAGKAKQIVEEHADDSDYEKLLAYKEAICGLVDYNHDATEEGVAYGDPWQLIWVFDDNSGTKVVCEGYSKAFQYLCDLSTFASPDTRCYTVTGTMSGGTGAGGHMWNIVTLDGQNYLVDITNCDDGSIGNPDLLFLAGTTDGNAQRGYTFNCNDTNIIYTYDKKESDLLGDVLNLAGTNYDQKGALKISGDLTAGVTYGDEVTDIVIQGGTASTKEGEPVAGTFRWSNVTSYGDAGTKTLKAVFVPKDDSYGRVTNISVTVTVKPKNLAPEVKINPDSYEYTGSAVVPKTVTVLDGNTVIPESEYTLSYTGNVNAGTATVTVDDQSGGNYNLTGTTATFTIQPAACTPSVISTQDVVKDIDSFIEPVFRGVNGEKVAGTIIYGYDSKSGLTYEQMEKILADLPLNTTGTINYSFTASDNNYKQEPISGEIVFTIKDVLFQVGGETATVSNAVTVKSAPTYGDSWTDIVKIGSITAVAGSLQDSDASHFTLKETGIPNAGEQEFTIVYKGTLDGKPYKDSVVCTGKVNIAKRTITVSAGSGKVSKTYDGTTSAGTLSGSVSVTGILSKDTGVTVRAVPAAYTSPDVGGQTSVQTALTIEGDSTGNYQLANSSVMIPCEILPKVITPSAALIGTGSYVYTGEAITPGIEVKDGNVLLKSSDYTLTWSDHIHAGTAKVVISSKAGGNYTWTTPKELTFTIEKAAYAGTKSMNVSTRYGREGTFDLASFLPEGYQLGTLQIEDSEQILRTVPVVKEGTISYQLVSDQTLKGKQAVITIPVTKTGDYEAFEFKLTVTLVDKLEQSGFGLDAENLDKIYGDEDFVVLVKNAVPDSRITYTSSDPAVASVDGNGKIHILKIGTTVITAEASETEDYLSAAASCTLIVTPKALVWDVSALSAVDKDGTISGKKASLYGELRVSGILKGDDAVFTCPADQLIGTYGAVTPGEQKVTLAWAKDPVILQGTKSGNYKMPQTLPELIGRINAVSNNLPTPPESTKEVQFQLEVEKGISGVPESFKGMENLNTPVKIDMQMRLSLQKASSHIEETDIEVYDVILMVKIADGGWQEASKENFPSTGLTITLPYPEGTGRKTHDFMVSHLFTEDMNGHRAGEMEYPAVTKTADGIRFKVYGLSPISIGWTDAGVLHNPESGGNGNGHSSGSSESSSATTSQRSSVQSAATADESPIDFYVGMMVLSVAGLVYIFAGRRRRKIR